MRGCTDCSEIYLVLSDLVIVIVILLFSLACLLCLTQILSLPFPSSECHKTYSAVQSTEYKSWRGGCCLIFSRGDHDPINGNKPCSAIMSAAGPGSRATWSRLQISGKHVKIIYWAIREIYSSIYSFGRRIHWIGRIDTEAFSKED